MNMEKLGTVSALGVRPPKLMKPNNGGACRVTTYTLCDNRNQPIGKGWRHGFAFDGSAFRRQTPPPAQAATASSDPLGHPLDPASDFSSGSVCNTRTRSHGWDRENTPRSLTNPAGNGFEGDSKSRNYSAARSITIPPRSGSPAVTGEYGNLLERFPAACRSARRAEDAPPAGRISPAKILTGRHDVVRFAFWCFLSAHRPTVASRWANPDGGRKPRQRRRGIVHGLRAELIRFSVFWVESVALPAGAVVESVIFSWGRPFYPLARSAEWLVWRWLLLGWPCYLLARPYLRRKWAQIDAGSAA